MTTLAAIVAVLGRAALTRRCLTSLVDHGVPGMRIVVVENGTTENRTSLSPDFPSVEWVSLPRNEGFAGGYDRGLSHARQRWDPDLYLVLNNDATLADGSLATLVQAIGRDPRIGMAAPKILGDQADGRLWCAGNEYIAWRCMARNRGEGEVDRGQWDRPEDLEVLSACALLMRRELIDDIGMFDERFFAYGEDVDLSRRARRRGWRLAYVPRAVAFHTGSATAGGQFEAFQSFYRWRNRLLLIWKHAGPIRRLVLAGVFLPALIARDLQRYARRGDAHAIPYLWRGLAQAVAILLGRRPEPLRDIEPQARSIEKSGGTRRRFGL